MATLTLTATWIHLLSTGDFVTAGAKRGRGLKRSVEGERRRYAGGRMRAYTVEGVATDYDGVELVAVTADQLDTLDSWLGQTVQVRDNLGQLVNGFYLQVPRIPLEGTSRFNCPLTIFGVTVEDQ